MRYITLARRIDHTLKEALVSVGGESPDTLDMKFPRELEELFSEDSLGKESKGNLRRLTLYERVHSRRGWVRYTLDWARA